MSKGSRGLNYDNKRKLEIQEEKRGMNLKN
jgi:hypothetical protein